MAWFLLPEQLLHPHEDMRRQVPGPSSLDGQGDGESLQGQRELPSDQGGCGGVSLHRDAGHRQPGDCGITACVKQAAGAGRGCSTARWVFGAQGWVLLRWGSCATSLPQAPVSLLLLHPGSASLLSTEIVAFIGTTAVIALFQWRFLMV